LQSDLDNPENFSRTLLFSVSMNEKIGTTVLTLNTLEYAVISKLLQANCFSTPKHLGQYLEKNLTLSCGAALGY
jgi:hypothetical protein